MMMFPMTCTTSILIIFVIENFIISSAVEVLKSDPTTIRNFSVTNYVSSFGYPIEAHKNIQTSDGYLLDMHRIPSGKSKPYRTDKKPVLLMHGILASTEGWLARGTKSLALMLADQGYDVWMGNARGSIHSRKHISLNPDTDSAFWSFSWHEIGVADLPAMIDYIRNTTQHSKLSYIGHSQGTTTFFVMASERPEYNAYIDIMIALAPVAYMSPASLPGSFLLSPYQRLLHDFVTIHRFEEVNLTNRKRLCRLFMIPGSCNLRITLREKDYDDDTVKLVKQTYPAGAATMQLLHYAQEIISGDFCQFDYGPKTNIQRYSSIKPPSYNINKITTPIALVYAKMDELAPPRNVERLARSLRSVVKKIFISNNGFSHTDFLLSNDAIQYVYPKLITLLNKY